MTTRSAPTGADRPVAGAASRAVPLPPPPPASEAAPTAPAIRGLTWLGPGITLRLTPIGMELRDPLAYFCVDTLDPRDEEPAAVDLRLPVADQSHEPVGRELGYWPRYDQLTPSQRRLYLDWLARGRSSIPLELGYTFLFIYGLERRALVERQDVKLIFKEVLRLRQLYARSGQAVSRSFEGYTSSLLWFLLVREPGVFASRHFEALAKSTRNWDDDRLAAALCWLARGGQPLPDWLAFTIAGQLTRSLRSVVARRVGDELRALFVKRYRKQFGDGLVLKTAKRDRTFSYRPASAALRPFAAAGPNPAGVSSQFNLLSDLWNECIADLKRLSSVVANAAGEDLTVEAWNALPPELRAGVDHPLTDRFAQFIEDQTADATHTIVPARALATLVGVPCDAKLTTAACRRMAETVENVGYCVEPDARLTGRAYEAEESVILFLNLGDGAVDVGRYPAASTMLSVGLALAEVDGQAHEGELSLLTQHVDSAFELNEHEQRRLGMLRALRAAKGIELSAVTKPLKRLQQAERERVAKFALALVAADGLVTKDELKAVRRLYAAMGFDRGHVDAAVAAMTAKPAAPDEPVTVLPAVAAAAPGEAIPRPPAAEAPVGLKLDRAAIASILKDTLEVSRMLADAMNLDARHNVDHDTQGVAPPPEANSAVQSAEVTTAVVEAVVDPTVPARYAAFYQVVVSRPQWTREELAAIAKQHGLMLSGAVEAINDWATEKHGGPLLYEDDRHFTLESAYLN